MLSVLALAFGALTFQSCEDYPNGASRGYYHGGYYDGGYYGGGDYGPTVVVSSGDRERHHGDGYSNEYYDRENGHVNRNDQVNGKANTNRNVNVNRNVNTNRNVHPNRNVRVNRNSHVDRNVLQGKVVGITGTIELYQGKPEIKVISIDQIKGSP